jgi:hypothetical protein
MAWLPWAIGEGFAPALEVLPYEVVAMTALTGLAGANSFLALGCVFAANLTGNIVVLGFYGRRCLARLE